jgi:hypothetical protein
MAGHLVYLYQHREFGPSDFLHPFILTLEEQAPEETVKKQVSAILQQKFTYLGSGTQVTAYESADHHYVIKFFNPRNTIKENWFHKTSRLCRMSSLKWIFKTYFKKEERLLKSFNCHRMAFQDLREESGLIYLHFDRSSCLSQKIELVDKEGKFHQVDLDECPFVLQKKVELALEYLTQSDSKEACEGVRQLYWLFLSRAQKGYTDHHQKLSKNFGFAGGYALQLDVGRICKDKSVQERPLQEVERVIANIAPSLPAPLALVLQECLEESLRNCH